MPNQLKVTCFTDLEGSTSSTEALGHEEYLPRLHSFHEVVEELAELTSSGKYKKDTGDGDILTFEDPDVAVKFAMQLQAYYAEQPSLKRPTFRIRIGLFDGVIQESESNAHGSGVNQAARVQGWAEVGQIVVNKALCDHLKTIWGPEKAKQYFVSIGERELKGIKEPPEQVLFAFEWQQYSQDNPDASLVRTVVDHLRKAYVEVSNLTINDLAKPGTIIWPVVPRNLATAIHRGQAEIIRLLTLLGWNVKLLIADCRAGNNYPHAYSEAFQERLGKYIAGRNIGPIETAYLSDFYLPSYSNYDRIQHLFRLITSEISLQQLEVINNKSYDSKKQEEIKQSPTLDFLRPALSIAAVIHLAEQVDQKVIVIAGADEGIQWQTAYDIADSRNKIGVLMNPVLKQDRIHQDIQKASWPSWASEEALVRDMSSEKPTNLAWWVFNLHAFIPSFPSQSVRISDNDIVPQDWLDQTQVPANKVSLNALAHRVWSLLDTAI